MWPYYPEEVEIADHISPDVFYQPIFQSFTTMLASNQYLRTIGNIRDGSFVGQSLLYLTNHRLFSYYLHDRLNPGRSMKMRENESRFARHLDGWRRICMMMMAFRRANPFHYFRDAILQADVMCSILQFASDVDAHESQMIVELSHESMHEWCSLFLNTRYVLAPRRNRSKRKF